MRRREQIETLIKQGLTHKQIGLELHISERDVGRILRGEHRSPLPAGPRLTPAQRHRRRQASALLFKQGYSLEAIGYALDCSPSSVNNDVHELGIYRRRPNREILHDLPEKIDWRSEPDEATLAAVPTIDRNPPAYRTSDVIHDAQHWVEGFNNGDFPNRLAWNVNEAMSREDEAWLGYARDLILTGYTQFSTLLRILDSEDFRRECMSGRAERTRVTDTPKLRVIPRR